MIEGYVGKPGAGKTYAMTARALRELKAGHRVFANYHIEGAESFAPEDLLDLPPGFIVLDEAHLWLSSRSFHKLPHSWLVKLSQTRKSGWHLLWSAQHPSRADKALRDVTHLLHWCHSWPNALISGKRPRYIWANCYEPFGKVMEHDPRDRDLMFRRETFRFSMKVANAYDTFESIVAASHLEGDRYSEVSKAKRAQQAKNEGAA